MHGEGGSVLAAGLNHVMRGEPAGLLLSYVSQRFSRGEKKKRGAPGRGGKKGGEKAENQKRGEDVIKVVPLLVLVSATRKNPRSFAPNVSLMRRRAKSGRSPPFFRSVCPVVLLCPFSFPSVYLHRPRE